MISSKNKFLILGICLFLQACVSAPKPPKDLLSLNESQMKIRSFQTRTFDIKDQGKVMRGVVAALQDLGFIVERANGPMGLVTAGKFAGEGHSGFVELTVTVRAKGDSQVEIRVNAILNTKPIEDPKVYQNFFAAVQRSLFLPG
jgi:hypothetical protein